MASTLSPEEILYRGDLLLSDNGDYQLILQGDGNLVLYSMVNDSQRPLWASKTDGRDVENCIMQGDGNLVIYAPDGTPVWASGTTGQGGSYLTVQDDGNAVIYTRTDRPIWTTNTQGQR